MDLPSLENSTISRSSCRVSRGRVRCQGLRVTSAFSNLPPLTNVKLARRYSIEPVKGIWGKVKMRMAGEVRVSALAVRQVEQQE